MYLTSETIFWQKNGTNFDRVHRVGYWTYRCLISNRGDDGKVYLSLYPDPVGQSYSPSKVFWMDDVRPNIFGQSFNKR
jgi:hypothetical protein